MTHILRSALAPLALLAALLIACGTARPASAQADSVLVVGTLVNESREPIPGAQVVFTRLDGPDSIARVTMTNEMGQFRIRLPGGSYYWEAAVIGRASLSGVVEVEAVPGQTARVELAPARVASGSPLPGLGESKHFNLSDINYFVTGFDFESRSDRPDVESASQVKFRISLRYKLVNLPRLSCDSCRSGLYAAYTQNSFWHFYDDSAPFFDNNYSPGLLAYYAFGADGPEFEGIALFAGVVHESNGRDLPHSRGWQRTVVGATAGAVNRTPVSGTLSLWNPWDEEDTNPDLVDYAGRGELTLFLQPWADDGDAGPLTMQLRTRLFGSRAVRNVELNLMGDVPFLGRWLLPQPFVQVFSGYAENLLTYDEKRTVVRVGLGLLR